MRKLCLLLTVLWGSLTLAQSETPAHIVDAARRAAEADLAELDAPTDWSHAILADVETTALGCALIAGLNLPMPIEAYRLELRYGDEETYAVHVSSDGSMAQLCDERFPALRSGLVGGALANDRDGDTVLNRADACPNIAGRPDAAAPGCPQTSANDRDGDSVPNSIDFCPDQAGAAAADGCSLLADADGDGVPDIDDLCRHDGGIIRSGFAPGCPANGSGSSTQRRESGDVCRISGDSIRLFERGSPTAGVIGVYEDSSGAGEVIGRDAAAMWYQLRGGWAHASWLTLHGACYNIPIVSVSAGSATGCFLQTRGELATVRNGPSAGSRRVAEIRRHQRYPVLGQSLNGDWLFFNQGWVSRAALELAGNCDPLPILDPQKAGSGTLFFCPPEYEGYLRPRIAVGKANARIPAGRQPNRLREEPGITAAQIGEIASGQTVDAVLDGPACKENYVWWQVQVDGMTGWTAESDVRANVYYIEPVGDAEAASPAIAAPANEAQPATLQMISSANAARVNTIGIIETSAQGLVWSPMKPRLAIINSAGGIEMYSYPDFARIEAGYHLPDDLEATALAFSADERSLAVGTRDGQIYVAQDGGGAWLVQSHNGAVQAAVWSQSGGQLASIGGRTLKVWQMDGGAAQAHLLLNYSFPYPLADVAFSADDAWLAVTGGSADNARAAIWIYDSAAGDLRFSKALIYSPGGSLAAAIPDAALGDFAYVHGDSVYRIDVESGEDLRFYHQAGGHFGGLAFRQPIIKDADVLFAITLKQGSDAGMLNFVNALNRNSPPAALMVNVVDVAFSPDGRVAAVAEADRERVLLLGVTDR